MKTNQMLILGIIIVIVAVFLLSQPRSQIPNTTTTTTLAQLTTTTLQSVTTTTLPSTVQTVIIKNKAFIPNNLTIHVGDTVLWMNQDDAGHSVQGAGLASPYIKPGESWNYTFTEPKEYFVASGTYPTRTRMTITVLGDLGKYIPS